MADRFGKLRQQLEDAVWRGPGRSPAELRQQAGAGRELPPELGAFIAKIHQHAHRVTDEEVAALRRRYSDEQLYEIVVSATVGAARTRLDAGQRALDAAYGETGGGDAAARR